MKFLLAPLLSLSFSSFATTLERHCHKSRLYPENVSVCIDLRVPRKIALGCGTPPLSIGGEFTCLYQQASPEVAWKCAERDLSESKEEDCIILETVILGN